MIRQERFGTDAKGREVLAFTLSDGESYAVILNYGGILQSLAVPDREGKLRDVVLGYKDVAGYETNGGYLGALIGRFGNRIGEGKLTVDGKTYSLYCNDRGNHLHGGKEGFNRKIWEHKIEGDELVLTLFSPDGEENYPGNLSVTVRYSFHGGTLSIKYRATTDRKTVVNLTNHAYFNLSGEGSDTVLDHELWIDSDEMVPTNDTMIPVGGFRAVKGTAFDFNVPKTIGKDIGENDPDLVRGNGYDHCFVLKNGAKEYVKYASAYSPKSGITLTCYTDMPAVQLYTGNGLHQTGKGGMYGKRSAFCLETEAIPNNPNVEEYAAKGSSYLDADEVYEFSAAYHFGVK